MDKVGNITCIYCKFPYNNNAKKCMNCGRDPLGLGNPVRKAQRDHQDASQRLRDRLWGG